MTRYACVFLLSCGPAAAPAQATGARVTDVELHIDEAVARESLDERVTEEARSIDARATRIGNVLHGEKASQHGGPCLAPNCGLPELEWEVTLDAGCYWVIAVAGKGIASLQAKLEGRGVVSTGNEFCIPITNLYRLLASATGHGVVALGLYRKANR